MRPDGYQGVPPDGYQDVRPDGYQGGPPGGFQDVRPDGYQDGPPGGGYREPPAVPAQLAGSAEAAYPPTGPLPVGQWHAHEQSGEYPSTQPGDEFQADPLDGGYHGEAEQGYLPSPPTDMFPAAPPSGAYRGQGSHHAGYEPDPVGPVHPSRYPAEHADRRDPTEGSFGYGPRPGEHPQRESGRGEYPQPEPGPDEYPQQEPGPGEYREREYGHSRGRS